jgi:hypothetical protein
MDTLPEIAAALTEAAKALSAEKRPLPLTVSAIVLANSAKLAAMGNYWGDALEQMFLAIQTMNQAADKQYAADSEGTYQLACQYAGYFSPWLKRASEAGITTARPPAVYAAVTVETLINMKYFEEALSASSQARIYGDCAELAAHDLWLAFKLGGDLISPSSRLLFHAKSLPPAEQTSIAKKLIYVSKSRPFLKIVDGIVRKFDVYESLPEKEDEERRLLVRRWLSKRST